MKRVLGMEVGLSPGDSVLDGDPAPPHKGMEPPPHVSAHFYSSQTAGCINMPLGMEVGLSPGDFVLDGDQAPYPKRGGAPSNFWPTSIVAKRLHGSRCHLVRSRGLRDTVFNVDPASPEKRAHPPPPTFWPMSIVAKWLDG